MAALHGHFEHYPPLAQGTFRGQEDPPHRTPPDFADQVETQEAAAGFRPWHAVLQCGELGVAVRTTLEDDEEIE